MAVAACAVLSIAHCAIADELVQPNPHLKVEGVPAIPSSLAAALAPYTEFRPRAFASWHPDKREMLVATRVSNTVQLNRVDAPLAALAQITDYPEPVRWGTYWPPRPSTLVFLRDTGGNEQTQLYRRDADATAPVLLTDPQRAHAALTMNHARDHLLMGSVELDKTGRRENPTTDLALLDPLNPGAAAKIATLPGTGWFQASFSADDRRIALVEGKSVNETYIWVMEVATGKRERVLPREGEANGQLIASKDAHFARDGKGLFLTTDRDGEFQRAAYLDLESGKLDYFGPEGFDVEALQVSPDGRRIALVTNEGGAGVLRLYDATTRKETSRPAIPLGIVSRAHWHDNSRDLAFDLDSAKSPGDVYSVDTATAAVTRWTESAVAGLDAAKFASWAPISWKSFDDRTITGFIARPPSNFSGPRPALVIIHGGPEAQARPSFLNRLNYYVTRMGVAVIEPNVRGSIGFGKTFVALDNGMKREDSVKDIGALLDWIAKQPDLDSKRVVVAGGSYGGYMSLAVATHYADRIAGTIDVVGIANFVSFLERTESYRRDLRRVEYGDERDPAMREFLTRISPVTNADQISKPMLVVAGKNDPRVPYTESEQIVAAARKKGVEVWYLLADNEGHGYARKDNTDFYFYATVRFLQEVLKLQ